MCYLQIVNTFWNRDMIILKEIVWETQKWL